MADKQKNIPEFEIKPAELVYTSAKIKKVMRHAASVAKDPGCLVVTILGESGVMKTEIARWIAKNDKRKGKIIEIPLWSNKRESSRKRVIRTSEICIYRCQGLPGEG